MSSHRKLSTLCLLGALLVAVTPVAPARADIVISELQAVNNNTVQDEDGEFSDYFELYNSGPSTVDLDGYYATDDPFELTKWRFPAVSLAPNSFLLVFASEKNRDDPGLELHTSFRLTSRGEYLALVEPDGVTVAFEYAPEFPEQFPGVSYGVSQEVTLESFIEEGDTTRYLIPPSGSTSLGWTQPGFNDASWSSGPTAIGFDRGSDYTGQIATDVEAAMHGTNASIYTRTSFSVDDPAALDSLTLAMKYDDGFVAYLNGTRVASRNAPSSLSSTSSATAEHGQPDVAVMQQNFDQAGTSYVLRSHGTDAPPRVLSGGPTGRYLELMRDNVGSLANTCGFNVVPGPTDAIFAEFDYRMPVGGDADGFAFALLETATWGNSGPGPDQNGFVWERPAISDTFAVGFDIWPAGEENSININWDGAERSSRFVNQFELHNGVFNRVNVELRKDGPDTLVTVVVTPDYHGNRQAPVTIFDDYRITGMSIREARVCFGGRTGGAFTSVDIDNITVQFTPGSTELQFEEFDLDDDLDLLQSGTNILAVHGLNRTASDGDFILVPRLMAIDAGGVQSSTRLYFTEPTPGTFNGPGLSGVAPRPEFSHPGGAYPGSFSLTLSSSLPGSTVRYTTDGTEPTSSSPAYSSSISITTTRLVKARTFRSGFLPSPTVTNLYMRLNSDVRNFTSNLPIVILDTRGSGIGSGSFTPGQAIIVEVDPGSGRAAISDDYDFGGSIGLKQRGSSSAGFPKKQWAMEIWDENQEDTDASILGMPPESDWILYAPYSDKTLMNNYLAYKWSNDIGQYAVRTRFVEVFLNTGTGNLSYSSHYHGVYVLMEKIKRNPERVDVERLTLGDNEPPEVTGGYIIKKDRLDPGDSGFTTSRGQTLAYVEPKENEITPQQDAFLQGYFNSFESALYGANFRDPEFGYARYFDAAAAIDHHILVELCKNIDGYRLSTFAYIPRGGKITMGPIWDYNLSLGNANYLEGWIPQGWYYPLIGSNQYPWYPRLFQDPDFEQAYIDRFTELLQTTFTEENLIADIDEAVALLSEAQQRNFQRWPILGSYVWPNPDPIPTTYAGEINAMKSWLRSRLTWIASNWPRPPSFSERNVLITPGYELFLSTPTGTIYYTLDGSDPRLSGGGISPDAFEYGSSASATLLSAQTHSQVRAIVPTSAISGTTWTGRTYNDSSWSSSSSGIGVGYENGSGYESYIDLDVGAMADNNGSVYVRVPFNVDDPSAFSFLTLEMLYDDGFIAYLNGTRVAGANDPASPSWDSLATAQHDDAAAVVYQTFDISAHVDRLVSGTNILAIHGLNATLGSSDLLLVPRLRASGVFTGDGLVLEDFARIRARARTASGWSGPSSATFALDDAMQLRVTEMLFHPPDPPPGSPFGDEDYEFIEIQNIGASTIDLRGVELTDGIEFDFTGSAVTSLAPGAYVVVVRNLAAFETIFDPTAMAVAGEFTGNLENRGENVRLQNAIGDTIHEFRYDDTWYPAADGGGYSLVAVDVDAEPGAWSLPENWQLSDAVYGSPGSGDTFSGGLQLPGDANQDSFIDVGDAVSLLLMLFRGETVAAPCDGANAADGANVPVLDFNGDSTVDTSDVVGLLVYLYRDGSPHVGGTSCVRIEGCPSICIR